jgi:hypothetical protein
MEVYVHNENLTWKEKKRQHGQDKIWRDCFCASLIYDDGLLNGGKYKMEAMKKTMKIIKEMCET